jgi:hypothetical protein
MGDSVTDVALGSDLVVVLIVNVTLIIYTSHMTLASADRGPHDHDGRVVDMAHG